MEKNLKKLVKDLSNPDEDLRALSAMTLMKLDVLDPEARDEIIGELMKATKDKNISVRFFSRKALDKIRRIRQNEGAFITQLPLDEALLSEDFECRLDAVMRISKENRPEFKEKLVAMLEHERHDFVKAALISCLKKFLTKEEARVFSGFLKDPDNRVRSNTIEALEHVKADESIPLLFPCLEDPDNRIRAVAAKALQSFGEAKVFAVMKKMLSSKEEWMKVSAIHSLSHIQAGEAIKLLLDAAKPPGAPETRLKAIIALANYHDSASYGFLKFTSGAGEEPFKSTAAKALKLFEEKFGPGSPTKTLVEESLTEEKAAPAANKGKPAPKPPQDFSATVTKFFRKGKEEAVGLSQKAAINFAVTDLEKEQKELLKEAGRVLFEIYQRGDLKIPELLTLGHEILRMNFFIQKYTEEEEKKAPSKQGGFFAQLKNLFSSAAAHSSSSSQIDKFTQKREDLFQKLGEKAFFKMKIKEFSPLELEGYHQAYLQLEAKIQKEKEPA